MTVGPTKGGVANPYGPRDRVPVGVLVFGRILAWFRGAILPGFVWGGAGVLRAFLDFRWKGGWTPRGLSLEASGLATPGCAAGLRDPGLFFWLGCWLLGGWLGLSTLSQVRI